MSIELKEKRENTGVAGSQGARVPRKADGFPPRKGKKS